MQTLTVFPLSSHSLSLPSLFPLSLPHSLPSSLFLFSLSSHSLLFPLSFLTLSFPLSSAGNPNHANDNNTYVAITSGANMDFDRLRFVSERADATETFISGDFIFIPSFHNDSFAT